MAKLARFWLFYHAIKLLFLKNIKIRVKGLENIPKNKGFIIACNHEHSWDPVLIAFAFKRQIHFLSVYSNYTRVLSGNNLLSSMEKLVFKGSVSGFFLRFTQQIPVSYTDKLINKEAILKASHYLKRKEIVGIFPEGELKLKKKRIFPGAAVIAKRSNAAILPAHIGTNAPCDSFLKPNFTKVRINIGNPLRFYKSANYTKKLVMKRVYALKND